MSYSENQTREVVPEEIQKRLKEYRTLFLAARTLHYSIGILGLTCSLMATSGFGGGDIPRYWALGSGVCYGLLAFLDPNSKYLKFSKAARVLEQAYLEYKYGKSPLIQSFGQAEELITHVEKLEANSRNELDRVRDGNKFNDSRNTNDIQLQLDKNKGSSNQ
jgi:hypothetical protein